MIPANVSACYVRSGNNSNKIFDFDFPIDKPEDLIVIKLNSETDERKTLVFNSDYSIKEFSNPLGSSITYPINSDNLLSDKEKLLLISSREIKQQYLFNSSDDFDMKTFEKALDYIVTLIKQLDYTVSRTIKLPEGMDGVYADEFLSTFLNNLARAEVLAEAIKNGIEYTDKAEIWAEGTDEEVQKIGGVHSAKEWANQSAKGQIQTDWNETDKNSKSFILNKPKTIEKYLTNYSTIYPVIQYSNKTITLKSGFKGLSANGRLFDGSIDNYEVETTSDLSLTYSDTDTGQTQLCLVSFNNGLDWQLTSWHYPYACFEQENQPYVSVYGVWYNSNSAKWSYYNNTNGVWKNCLVVKLGIVILDCGVITGFKPFRTEIIKRDDLKFYVDGNISAIKKYLTNCILNSSSVQYSNKTITLKSGFKGLSANGRLFDGSIDNYEVETTSDLSLTYSDTDTGQTQLCLVSFNNGLDWQLTSWHYPYACFEQENQPYVSVYGVWYNSNSAKWSYYNNTNGVWKNCLVVKLGIVTLDCGVITGFKSFGTIELIKRDDLKRIHVKPDWNLGSYLAVNTDNYINRSGFVLFKSSGVEQTTWSINGNIIGGNFGLNNYWQDWNSILCPVSIGDVVKTTGGSVVFYPEKEGE